MCCAGRRQRKHTAADDSWQSVFDQLEADLAEDPRRSGPLVPIGAEQPQQSVSQHKIRGPRTTQPAFQPGHHPDPADYDWQLQAHHQANATKIYSKLTAEGVAQIDYYYTTSKVKLHIKKSQWGPEYCIISNPQQFISLLKDPAGYLKSRTKR